ncbi:MAG: hypothetical protein KME17_13810 [Cyanosarcina radialis HA8281-LM2]|jgi:hypothetical protein|nr:hypothetical protein [Cyanosarcina radialis HA8281-LM2]
MTAIALNLSPELEQKLRLEAAKAGIDLDRYIVNTLEERLLSHSTLKKATEADLLQQINIGFSAETWEQYHHLIAKRHAETLSPEEREDLIYLSDRLEKLNVIRIQALIQLANLRNQPLSDLMPTLGIGPNPEVLDYA